MTKQVSLNDIYAVCNRLEDKFDKRMGEDETRLDKLENLQSKLIGGVSIVGLFVGGAITWVWERIKNG